MNDYREASRKGMERADKVSLVIFWGLVCTVIIVSVAVLKGALG